MASIATSNRGALLERANRGALLRRSD
jgi:hypothetical protein